MCSHGGEPELADQTQHLQELCRGCLGVLARGIVIQTCELEGSDQDVDCELLFLRHPYQACGAGARRGMEQACRFNAASI